MGGPSLGPSWAHGGPKLGPMDQSIAITYDLLLWAILWLRVLILTLGAFAIQKTCAADNGNKSSASNVSLMHRWIIVNSHVIKSI